MDDTTEESTRTIQLYYGLVPVVLVDNGSEAGFDTVGVRRVATIEITTKRYAELLTLQGMFAEQQGELFEGLFVPNSSPTWEPGE